MSTPTVDRQVGRWPYWITPSIHLALALTGPLLYVVAVAPHNWSLEGSPDANIGAGFAIIITAVFGLPWSIPVFAAYDLDSLGGNQTELLYASLALLNVALHAALARAFYRRAVRAGRRPARRRDGAAR